MALASPVPAYSVSPDVSVGSTINEPIALVGRPVSTASHSGTVALASSVRQMPPPAAAIHRRQLPGDPQEGSIAIAVTRPEVTESLRLSVTGPGANGRSGPKNCQSAPTPARALASRTPRLNCEVFR